MKNNNDICFTDFDLSNLWENKFDENDMHYLLIGREICPETDRPHIQGFVQFVNDLSIREFKKKYSSSAHLEWRKGTVQENLDYCKKEDDWTEFGIPRHGKQGKRSDWDSCHKDIKNGMKLGDIMINYCNLWLRYSNGIKSIYFNYKQMNAPKIRNIRVVCYVGVSGSGKTSRVPIDDTFWVNLDNKKEFLFDGYMGEKVILLDDFDGQISYNYMLRILDRYTLPLNIKNGRMMAEWEEVYITSNVTPELWYPRGARALKRRITLLEEVIEGNTKPLSLDKKINYNSVEHSLSESDTSFESS